MAQAAGYGLDGSTQNITFEDNGVGGQATYAITQANATATLGGSNSKTYDGAAVTLDEINSRNGDIKVTVSFPGATDAQKTIILTADDYVWDTSDGHAPIDASTTPYKLKLSTTGISRIKSLIESEVGSGTDAEGNEVSNVKFTENAVGGFAKFTIKEGTEDRYIQYQFVDADNNDSTVGSPVTVSGKAGQNVATGLAIPNNYALATGQTIPTSITFLDQSTDSAKPTVVQIKLVHQHGETTQYETRQITVHYVYGAGEHAGQKAHDDAVLDVYYKRTGDTDLVTNKMVDTAPWLFDSSYNADGFSNGYKVVSGTWISLPTSWNPVEAEVPTIDGYKAYLNGDWTKNKNGQQTNVPANKFVFPSFNSTGTTDNSKNSIAYTDAATVYEGTPEHTIYYVLAEQVEGRTVTEHFKKYVSGDFNDPNSYTDADVVTLPDGTKQSYAQIKVWYKKDATGFATNGSTDPSKWKATYSGWKWNSTVGDTATPGFTVISGKGLWSDITSNAGSPWGIKPPSLTDYETIVSKENLGFNSTTFGAPSYTDDSANNNQFTNATDPTWYFRNDLTTFYVPKSLLNKTVTRTIKIADPDGTVRSVTQKVTFKREARLNNNDTAVVLGGLKDDAFHFVPGDNVWNHKSTDPDGIPTGTWTEYNVTKSGYTALVDGNVVTSVSEVTVTPDTADTTVYVTYIKNSGTITISHDEVDQTYTGDAANTVIPGDIAHDIQKSNDLLSWPTGAENVTLDSSDFSFADTDGNILTDKPVNVGTYHVVLNKQGLDKFKALDSNFTWKYDPKTSYVVYKITEAAATATLSGENGRDYNGSAVSTADLNNGGNITVTIAIPNSDKTISYTLQDDDYTWTAGSAPTDQGTYTLSLNKDKVLAHLQAQIAADSTWKGNVGIADSALSGTATFTVNKKAATVSLNGATTVTYNGNQVATPLAQLKDKISGTGLVSGQSLDLSGLTISDFDWYDAAGNKLTSAPTNHGTYTIKLNATGLAALKNKNTNYDLSINNDQNSYGYEIKTAKGSVVLNGSRTITFGTADPDYYTHYSVTLTTDPAVIHGFTPSYTLQAGDLEFSSDNGRTWSTTVPTTVGTYQVKLSNAGRNNLIEANKDNGNITWPATNFTGIKTYIVETATATAAIAGNASMTYNGQAAELSDVNSGNIQVSVTIPGTTGNHAYTLQAGDYTWNTTDHMAPTDAGDYTISFDLTDTGKAHLKNFIDGIAGKGLAEASNVNIPTSVTGTADFKIDPLAITVNQSHSGEKTYDGYPASVSLDTLKNSLSGSGLITGQNLDTSTLTASDFDWYQGAIKLTSAPTDAGTYTVKLNAAGLTALQAANKNYSFSAVTGDYGYTIKQANATIKLDPTTNQQTVTWDGNDISLDLTKFKPSIITDNSHQATIDVPSTLTLTAGDYQITQDGTVKTPKEPGTYTVELTEQGWQKVRDAITGHGNYKWTSIGSGKLMVNKATSTVTLNGSASVTYTGATAQIPYDGHYTVTLGNGKTYTLQAGDLEFATGENPINVGDYTVKLSAQGLRNIQSAVDGDHYTYTYDDSTADLTVTPADATATINGEGSHGYNGSVASLSEGTYSVTLSNGLTYTLQAGDYNFVDNDGNVITAPTNFGSYKVGLTAQGKAAIEALTAVGIKNNYNWTFKSNATFNITAAEMAIIVEGEASKVYDDTNAAISADDITNGRVTLKWGNSGKPSDVNFTLTADDFEVVDVAGQPVKDVNFNSTTSTTTKTYYIKLKKSVLDDIQAQTNNYTFKLGDTNAFYTIYARKAALTLSGSQTVNYGSPEQLDLSKFQVVLSNWQGSGSAPTITLQAGDLEINLDGKEAYTGTNAGLPINVGRYTVKITDQLRNHLENDPRFSDYDFGDDSNSGSSAVSLRALGSSAGIDATHEPAVYIVQPRQIQVMINGSQSVKYGSNNYNDPSIINNNGQYTLSFNNIASRDTTYFNGYRLQSGDLTFVATPEDVGSYQVKLTDAGIAHLKAISGIDSDNYDWDVNVADARADFDVTQMPVTITVSDKTVGTGQSVAFGNSMTIDPDNYQVTITTEDGQTLTGWTPSSGDLQFDGPTPVNVSDQYKVILSADGLQSIQNKFGSKNYTYTSVGNGNFKVTPAEATITLAGSDSKTYDGQAGSPSASKYALTLPSGFTYNLTDADLEFVNDEGNVISAPVDAGDYHVALKDSVLAAIKNQDGNDGKNYTWTVVDKDAKYSITKATATVDFANDHHSQTVDYNGQSQFNARDFAPTITTNNGRTLSVPAGLLSVADGDFEFIENGETTGSTTEPLNVGSYQVKLTQHGLNKISNGYTANYDWTNNALGTYTVNAINITVSGNGSQTATYDGTSFGNDAGLDLSQFKPTLDASGVVVPTIPSSGENALTVDDYTIKQGSTEVTSPTKAGSYDVYLNANGLAKLKKLSGNFTWPAGSEIKVGTFTIKQTSASAVLSGSNQKTYDGQATSSADLNKTGGDIHVKITVQVGNDNKTVDYQLQDGDYIWDNGSTPVNAGSYTLSLNKDVILAHLKDKLDQAEPSLKGNYDLTVDDLSDQASFKINQKSITVVQSGSANKTYDGTPGSVTLDQLLSGLTGTDLVNGQSLNTTGLTLDDFSWSAADHTNAGTYQISLTPAGITKLQNDNPNYSFTPTGSFTYTINESRASASLSGHGEKTYDGQAVSDVDVQKQDANNNIQISFTIPGDSNPTSIILTANDFDWNSSPTIPTDAGTYTLTLNDHGKQAIKDHFATNHNIKWTDASFTGSATYVINKANGTITLNGSDGKTFDNQATTSLDGTKYSITVNGIKYDLVAGQYQIFDADGNEVSPRNVGTYYVVLTDSALALLEGDNYNWTVNSNGTQFANQLGTYVVSAASATARLSGTNSKAYDGQAVTVTEINHDGTVKVTMNIDGLDPVSYQLVAGDYDWVDASGNSITAPTNAGHYFIKLNSASLTNLQDALNSEYGNDNVVVDPTLTNSGQAEFDIVKAAQVIIHYQDVNGLTEPSGGWSGAAGTALPHDQTIKGEAGTPFTFDPTTGDWNYGSDHYILVGHSGVSAYPESGMTSADGNYYIGNYYVYLKHGTHTVPADHPEDKPGLKESDLNSGVTRKITVNMPNTTPTVITQTVNFTREATVDEVTGDITYSDWAVSGDPDLSAYTAPTVAGYTASPASVAKVTPVQGQTVDDVTINYTANDQSVAIKFVDDDDHGAQVGSTITESGHTNEQISLTLTVPTNYDLASGQTLPTSYTFTSTDDQTITIHLVHQTETVNGDDPDYIPSGVDKSQLIHTVTRTINDNLSSGTRTTTQTATITRSATYDKVTGELSNFSDWTPASWDVYTPTVPTGYTASPSSVPSEAITADTTDTTVDINYTASDQTVVIKFVDDDNNGSVVDTVSKTGATDSTINLNLSVPEHYALANGQTLPISYTFTSGNDQAITIHLVHKTKQVDGTKPSEIPSDVDQDQVIKHVTRTIVDELPSGTRTTTQTATLTRTATYDEVTHQLSNFSNWTNGTWNAYPVNAPDDYHVARITQTIGCTTTPISSIDAEQVTEETPDTTVMITYQRDSHTTAVTDMKTVTETIHYKYSNGRQAAPDKVVTLTFTRYGIKDEDSGVTTWGAWTPAGQQTFPAVQSPEIDGYTADQAEISKQVIDPDSGNLEFTIVYNKNGTPDNPDHPVTPDPTNPNNPTKPAQPGQSDHSTESGRPWAGHPGYTINGQGQIVGPDGKTYKKGQLPQTGNDQSELSGLGLVSLVALSLLGLSKKRRKDE